MKVNVVGVVESGNLKAVIDYLRRAGVKTDPNSLMVFNGALSFVTWLGETYGAVCLDL